MVNTTAFSESVNHKIYTHALLYVYLKKKKRAHQAPSS